VTTLWRWRHLDTFTAAVYSEHDISSSGLFLLTAARPVQIPVRGGRFDPPVTSKRVPDVCVCVAAGWWCERDESAFTWKRHDDWKTNIKQCLQRGRSQIDRLSTIRLVYVHLIIAGKMQLARDFVDRTIGVTGPSSRLSGFAALCSVFSS